MKKVSCYAINRNFSLTFNLNQRILIEKNQDILVIKYQYLLLHMPSGQYLFFPCKEILPSHRILSAFAPSPKGLLFNTNTRHATSARSWTVKV